MVVGADDKIEAACEEVECQGDRRKDLLLPGAVATGNSPEGSADPYGAAACAEPTKRATIIAGVSTTTRRATR